MSEEAHSQAPWPPEVVTALVARQQAEYFHPYTCLFHSDVPLEVTRDGLSCPRVDCSYQQTWVHEVDTHFRPFHIEL
jgi:hypothetical protein